MADQLTWEQMSPAQRLAGVTSTVESTNYATPSYSAKTNLTPGQTYAQGTYWGPNPQPGDVRATSGVSNQGGGGMDTWRYGSPADIRKAQQGGGGAGAPMPAVYSGPAMERPTLETPEKLKLGEYKPPEYDKGEEKKLRAQYMAPGMSQIRRSTSQAIISSKSLDNPNARSLFINKALEGVGGAVSQVSATAGQQARAEARASYRDELEKYNIGWKAKAEVAKTNWSAQWDKALADYKAAMGVFSQQPLGMQIEQMGEGSSSPSLYQTQLQRSIQRYT